MATGAGKVFEVLTEFRFDVDEAIVNSRLVQASVKNISDTADQAIETFDKLGLHIVKSLGFTGGILGILGGALHAADATQTAALDFTAVISTNMQYLTGAVGNFNDRLMATQQIMEGIGKEAEALQLNKSDLTGIVKTIIPILAPHGAAGQNFGTAIAMAKNALISSSGIGLSASQIGEQLASVLGGEATAKTGLLTRLGATNAFKGSGGVDNINAMDFKERAKLVSNGMKELGMDLGDLAARSNLLSTQLNRLKEFGNILAPLGNVLVPHLVGILKNVNDFISAQGDKSVKVLAQVIKSLISTPTNVITNVLQARRLKADVDRAATGVGFVGAVTGVAFILRLITGAAIFASPAIAALAGGIFILGHLLQEVVNGPVAQLVAKITLLLAGAALLAGILGKLGILFQVIRFVAIDILAPLLGFIFIFQAISRAIAMAQIDDAKVLVGIMPQILETFARLKFALFNILSPIFLAVDGLAQILEPLFRVSYWFLFFKDILDTLTTVLDAVGTGVIAFEATLSGLFANFFSMVTDISNADFSNMGEHGAKAFTDAFDDFMDKHLQKLDQGGNVSNHVTNIGKVEIRNDFKEQMEPDRVAFTLKEQLLKAAQNPTQARGGAFQAGTTRR